MSDPKVLSSNLVQRRLAGQNHLSNLYIYIYIFSFYKLLTHAALSHRDQNPQHLYNHYTWRRLTRTVARREIAAAAARSPLASWRCSSPEPLQLLLLREPQIHTLPLSRTSCASSQAALLLLLRAAIRYALRYIHTHRGYTLVPTLYIRDNDLVLFITRLQCLEESFVSCKGYMLFGWDAAAHGHKHPPEEYTVSLYISRPKNTHAMYWRRNSSRVTADRLCVRASWRTRRVFHGESSTTARGAYTCTQGTLVLHIHSRLADVDAPYDTAEARRYGRAPELLLQHTIPIYALYSLSLSCSARWRWEGEREKDSAPARRERGTVRLERKTAARESRAAAEIERERERGPRTRAGEEYTYLCSPWKRGTFTAPQCVCVCVEVLRVYLYLRRCVCSARLRECTHIYTCGWERDRWKTRERERRSEVDWSARSRSRTSALRPPYSCIYTAIPHLVSLAIGEARRAVYRRRQRDGLEAICFLFLRDRQRSCVCVCKLVSYLPSSYRGVGIYTKRV